MATINDILKTVDGSVAIFNGTVMAYTASSQPAPPLIDNKGNALLPVGLPIATAASDPLSAWYTLAGLVAGTPYHLYVQPPPSSGLIPYWLYWRVADVAETVVPCLLYGSLYDASDTPANQTVQAWVEGSAVITGGGVLTTSPLILPVDASVGTFAIPLWPTASLNPQVLTRVQVAQGLWRGSIPSQQSIAFDAWVALTSTTRLA